MITDIVARATSLSERLAGEVRTRAAGDSDRVSEARLRRWCQLVAQGDWKRFERRLSLDGLSLEEARSALGTAEPMAGRALPPWADTLSAVLELTSGAATSGEPEIAGAPACVLDPERPLPFEEALIPFVRVAERKLAQLTGGRLSLLSEEARASLERALLEKLSTLSARVLLLEFSVFREGRLPLNVFFNTPGSVHSRVVYDQFIDHLLHGGLANIIFEFAVLGRLLATTCDLWVEATTEFLERLESDGDEIGRSFGAGRHPGRVTGLRSDLSDPHYGGRTVIELTFESGAKLLYKPKDLGLERAYFDLLRWLNRRVDPHAFKTLEVLDRGGYGWVEFAEHRPCRDLDEARHYYERAGMLLCVVYALAGVDCQRDNIIACGTHPVLIDAEMIMSAPFVWHFGSLDAATDADKAATRLFLDSVLGTFLLPWWEFGLDGAMYDWSGFGGAGGQGSSCRARRWRHINTDRMSLDYDFVKIAENGNIPYLGDSPLMPWDYAEDVVNGFRQMYDSLANLRSELTAAQGPLGAFKGRRCRFLLRPTRAYALLMRKMLDPKLLRDGADRSIHLDLLSARLLDDDQSRFWPLLRPEIEALERGDVPHFSAITDSDVLLMTPGQSGEVYFTQTGYDNAEARLLRFGEEDASQQVRFIRGSLYSRVSRSEHEGLARASACGDDSKPLSAEELTQEAIAVARRLERQAIRAPDGGLTWIALAPVPQADRYVLSPMSFNLYDGSSGAALFFASLARVTGLAGYRDTALAALHLLRGHLAAADTSELITNGNRLSGGHVIYVLVRAGQLLGEPELFADAQRAAALFTPERIAGDRHFDVIHGAAGAILALLALYDETGHPGTLALARACGRHLLENRTESTSGARAWRGFGGQLLTGFSHGAAGIAYALSRLFRATGEVAFLGAAREAIDYENNIFVPAVGNWPDLRSVAAGGEPEFRCAWCHGATGIGLARLGVLAAAADDPGIGKDVETSVATTLRHGIGDVDGLCCGNFGRVELLHVAGMRLGRGELVEEAERRAAHVVRRAHQSGIYSFTGRVGFSAPGLDLGFFQGEAGIGYGLLRLAYPAMLPSVLLFD